MAAGWERVPRGAELNFLVAEIGRDEMVWSGHDEIWCGRLWPERFVHAARAAAWTSPGAGGSR